MGSATPPGSSGSSPKLPNFVMSYPSTPLEFDPQQWTPPSSSTAHVQWWPAAMSIARRPDPRLTGIKFSPHVSSFQP